MSRTALTTLLAASLAAGCQSKATTPNTVVVDATHTVQAEPDTRLARYESQAELEAYIAELLKKQQQRYRDSKAAGSMPSTATAEPEASAEDADDSAGGESITNTQEAGVDEGGIVKAYGDYLIVLRRGRLFSVRLSDKRAVPVSMVDVTPPGKSHQAWYDEMLVSDDTIVVVGYSYEAQATELGLFGIDDDGQIRYRDTHFLRSNDYYSSRNYASRLLGDKLVFYMPYSLMSYDYRAGSSEPTLSMPGVRAYGSERDDWSSIISATQIYQPIQYSDWPVLHTVVTCDLGKKDLSCTAQGIVGPYGRTFYVSQNAVYVWVQGGYSADPEHSMDQQAGVVYRLPLDGEGEPGAMHVRGAPIDQFSFKESNDGHLNVLVRGQGGGDWMWNPEASSGRVALLRVAVTGFTTEVGTARKSAYTMLPTPERGYSMQNRFVGDYVLYGTGSSWGYAAEDRDDRVFMHEYRGGGRTASLRLVHGVDRIEVMGKGAVVIGTDGKDLHFTSVDLDRAAIADRYTQKHASQGELRSHGFFYKPTNASGGVLGLPIRSQGQPGYSHLQHGSAQVLFLSVDELRFSRAGGLEASAEVPDDRCVVSCVDWYGNARPIFYKGRVFALLGYELVEGMMVRGQMREVGRTSFFNPSRLRVAN